MSFQPYCTICLKELDITKPHYYIEYRASYQANSLVHSECFDIILGKNIKK